MKRIITLLLCVFLLISSFGCAGEDDAKTGLGNGWEPVSSMELEYAHNFSVDYYEGGYKLLSLSDETRYLVVPQGKDIPEDIYSDIVILRQPIEDIYLVASAAMSLFDALDSVDNISLSGTKKDAWYNENAQKAMEEGRIVYAGKYSAPDYELILSSGCTLAVQSTMINHTPDVAEKLKELGINVLIDQSSHESHPLGRTEWIKLYAALFDKEDLAEEIFDRQVSYLNEVSQQQATGKTVVFFYISTNGQAVVRRSGDYITKMIELAGGKYVFDDVGDSESSASTVSIEMEKFYSVAKDADVIIYNSTIGSEVYTLDDLLAKSDLLGDFKAVKSGNVWCTGKNLYQDTTQLGLVIKDMNAIFSDYASEESLSFLYRLE